MPARALIDGTVQGQRLRQYDFTVRQYDSLIRLTATLCTLFPAIRCDYPRDKSGSLLPASFLPPTSRLIMAFLGIIMFN